MKKHIVTAAAAIAAAAFLTTTIFSCNGKKKVAAEFETYRATAQQQRTADSITICSQNATILSQSQTITKDSAKIANYGAAMTQISNITTTFVGNINNIVNSTK